MFSNISLHKKNLEARSLSLVMIKMSPRICESKVYVAGYVRETYKSACPQTMQSGNSQKQNHREGEINTTLGVIMQLRFNMIPGNSKNSYGKEAISYAQ